MKKTLLYVLFALIPLFAISNNHSSYSFLHITGENGLSQSNVKAILKDSYGFMWFGTKNGLNRYDGTSILQLDCDDYVAKRGNHNISALYEDKDKKLWVGTDRGVFLYDMMLDTFTVLDDKTESGTSLDNWVSNIVSDSLGNIWVVIPDQGVFRYQNKQLYFYEIIDRNNFKKETPDCIYVTSEGEVWVGTWGAGLFRYDAEGDKFEQFKSDKNNNSLTKLFINSICESDGWLIMAIQDGRIVKYHPQQHILQNMDIADVSHTFVRNVIQHGDEIWAGTHDGVYIINEKERTTIHLQSNLIEPFSLSDNIIYTMYQDNEGGMWLGTMFGGVNYLPNRGLTFEKYVPLSTGQSLSSKRVRELVEDQKGNIWIGTEDGGLNILSASGLISRVESKNKEHNNQTILNMSIYENKIYCGLFKQGLNIISPSGDIVHYSDREMNIEEGSVWIFFIDSQGRKWIGTGSGLFIADKNSFSFSKVNEVGYDWIFDIFEDREGNLWLASMGSGVWKYNPRTDSFEKYINKEGDPRSLSSNSVSSVMQDSKGRIWLSTDRGGICRYNPDTNDFTSFSIKEGLPDDVAYEILEDDTHNLWFGTNKGLVKMNPDTKDIHVYTTKDGLLGNQFNYKSALKARDGRFFFGGINGLIAFNPNTVSRELVPPSPIYISKFSIYNKEITVHTPNSPLKKNIVGTEEIVLPYNQSNISFDIALLSYATSKSNQYYYRLDPLDKDWVKALSNQNISYAKLSPGKYVFRIQADNSSSQLASRSLSIVILPPWWLSTWAYCVYILLFVCSIWSSFYWYKRRKEKQMHENQKLFEIQKEKEVYETKVEFFTEIAHEIRTPLTLINGPLEVIREMHFEDAKLNKNLKVISQNTKRLLDLVAQLLDFQKIGTNKLKLIFDTVDVATLLKEICERFEPTIQYENKELSLDIPEETIMAGIDREAITKIVSNLLNNALKYSRKKIEVILCKKGETFVIQVISDGEKISEDMSEQIFEPFYRMETHMNKAKGIGIGLPLARSLASMHSGKLYLEKSKDAFNTFVLEIPLKTENTKDQTEEKLHIANSVSETLLEDGLAGDDVAENYTLLLVEDNEEMLNFIEERLKEVFTVEVAHHGKEALEILREKKVDLIISDVMMPVMDGWELCRILKSDIELCHIPIIFLTAKNDLDSKINGLKLGAEAYVEKPFSFNYLKVQILSLLNNRKKEREAFAKHPFFPVHNMQVNKADEDFMNKVIEVINENLSDENFNVERMADILCMSRSGMLRKIKMLFNLSPVDFIRLIRLRKAAELIQKGEYRVGEICYMVGINSPSYFSKLFMKQFGMSPKDFEKQSQSNKEKVDIDSYLKMK